MKSKPGSFLNSFLAASAIVSFSAATAATNSWNTGNGTWNTTTANWTSPATWTNGDHAVFSNTGSAATITLSSGITAGAVTVGNGGNNANYTFTGNGLSASSFILQGNPNNDDTQIPTSTFHNATISVTGNLGIGRMGLVVSGTSSVTATGRIGIDGITSADWGYLTIKDSANVTATNGIDGDTTAWGVNLLGGTLTTKSIRTADFDYHGAYLYFNGTTVKANTTDTVNSFISLYNGSRAYIGSGGAIIDTNGRDILISTTLADASSAPTSSNGGTTLSGSGGLTKSGAGTLKLTAVNTYSGGTIVNAGKLVLDNGSVDDGYGRIGGAVTVNSGATLELLSSGSYAGFGRQGQISSVAVNGGTISSGSGVTSQIWNISSGVQLTGGTLASNGGVSSPAASPFEWANTKLTSHASVTTSTVSGRIHILRDASSILLVDVADGSAATDLEISAALTESAPYCGLSKSGTGRLKLSGAVNLTGVLTVHAGTLDLSAATLGAGAQINVLKGASIIAPSSGLPANAVVFLDGDKLKPGSWGAPGSVAAGTAQFETSAISGATVMQVTDTGLSNRERWKQLEYGIFSHYTWTASGNWNADEAANGFDAEAYAQAVANTGAQYVVWTAWHDTTVPLYPTKVMEKYNRAGWNSQRDCVRAMIDAVKARGIRVFLYTHPFSISLPGEIHNNLINDLYAELLDWYGSDIDGLWIDENTLNATQDSVVDYTRLMKTIKDRRPDLVTMQNGEQHYTVDMGAPEKIGAYDIAQSEPYYSLMNPEQSGTGEEMFRTVVMQAAANDQGGGVHWSIDGVYGPGGGLRETTRINTVGRYLAPIRESVFATKPSASFPPPIKGGTYMWFHQTDWVATSSMDDSKEYIHVLKPRPDNTITLPAPADGKRFSAATLVCSLATDNGTVQTPVNLPMEMLQTPRGIRLTLPNGVSWSQHDTVIRLDVASKGGSGMVNNTNRKVTYAGSSWTYQKNRGLGEFNDDVHTATANGDSFTFMFSGTDVEYIATRAANRGPVDIYIDDVFQTTVDLSTGTAGSRQTVFRKSGLARGNHTLRCVKMGGSLLEVDAFRVSDLVNDSDPEMNAAFPSTLAASAAYGGNLGWWQPGSGGMITPVCAYYPGNEPLNDPLNNEPTGGDWFEVSFTGTGIDIPLICQFAWAYFYVKVDGVFHQNIDIWIGQEKTLSIAGLANGPHTVKCLAWRSTPDGSQPGHKSITVTRPDIWNFASNRGFGEVGDDVHYTDIRSGRFAWNFNGSGVEVITTRDSDARMGLFSLSGEGYNMNTRCNNYSSGRQTGTSVFSRPNLPPGSYQVGVQHAANTSGLNFSFSRLAIDAVRVFKGESMEADPLYWGPSGNGGSGTWDSGSSSNWFDGGQSTPWYDFGGSNYAAVFGGSGGTVNVSSGLKANRVTFESAGYSLQGNSLELNGTSPTVTVGTGTATIASTLTGSAGLTKTGLGTLSVTGSNACTGTTNIAEGSLKLNGAYASSSFAIASGAVLDFNAATALDLPSVTFSGTGTLRKTGSASLVWGSSSAVFALGSGSLIDVQAGTMIGGSYANENWTNNLSSLNVAAGAIFKGVEANVRLDAITGAGTIGTGYNGAGYQNLAIGVADGSSQFSGSITNTDNNASWSGNLVKQGIGTIELSGNSTYTGTTTVSAGKLLISGSVANTSTVTIASGAELEISGTLAASAQIINHGTLVLTGNPQMSAASGITNYGTIINRSKTYTLPGNVTNLGTILSVPGAPLGFTATPGNAQVTLNWNAVSGATSYTVKQSAFATGPFSNIASTTTNSQVISGLTNGTPYYFVVSASNAIGEGADSTTVSAVPAGLPSPFVTTDIGNVGIAGSASHSAGTYTLQGAGAGITGTVDACRFVYQMASGDCDVIVRVQSLTNTGTGAKTGVMVRESLNANARAAGVWVSPSSGILFTRRTSAGGTTAVSSSTGKTAPYWVRLTRTGSTFKAFYSTNGTSWTQFGNNRTISMASTTYIGIATTSGTISGISTGVFTNLSATP